MTDDRHPDRRTPPSPEAFRARLPHPTLPTNLPGVFANVPLPHGFDPNTASQAELVAHGLPLRRPGPGDAPVALRAWKRAFARPWLPENHVVPELEPRPGRRHGSARERVVNSVFNSPNWGGCSVAGAWTTVSAFWVVPGVTRPSERAGAAGGWHSASWIGIDGGRDRWGQLTSNDLLQAGVLQSVDGDGRASYTAWYEWLCLYTKVTLSDSTPSSFALASNGGPTLFLAFRGKNSHVNVMVSSDHGQTFGHKLQLSEQSPQGPALAHHQATIALAWTDARDSRIHIGTVLLTGNTVTVVNKVATGFTSAKSPALASFGGTLFLAWSENGVVKIASSTDSGQTFRAPLISTAASGEAPALAAMQAQTLSIAWKSLGGESLNVGTVVVADFAATAITNVAVIDTESTPLGPALAWRDDALFLSWKGAGNDFLSVMRLTDGGTTSDPKYVSPESSGSAPVLAMHEGQLFIGWRGEDDHLNVSVVGVRGRTIAGFSKSPDVTEIAITNFKVKPGDEVVCTVLYLAEEQGVPSAGYVGFGNVTTGQYLSITLEPPPAASFNGATVEWIMEAPITNGKQDVMPSFTPVTFTDAFGCGPGGALADPNNGDTYFVADASGRQVTSTTLDTNTVTITFAG